jgi:AcrR family transcriptional regulator
MSAAADPAAVAGIGVGVVPKRRRGIEVRRRLFEAALDEFEAHGVEESRVERIVAAAETSWGTFFRYFPRKEDVLLLAAAEHFRELVRPIVEAGLEDPDRPVRDVAREAFAALTTPVRSPRLHAEILFESVRYPVRFAAMVGEGELPVVLLFARLMEEGQRRGEVRQGIPPPICATVLAAGIVFSSAQVLRAVAAGEAPGSRIPQVAGLAFDAAWQGLEAPE